MNWEWGLSVPSFHTRDYVSPSRPKATNSQYAMSTYMCGDPSSDVAGCRIGNGVYSKWTNDRVGVGVLIRSGRVVRWPGLQPASVVKNCLSAFEPAMHCGIFDFDLHIGYHFRHSCNHQSPDSFCVTREVAVTAHFDKDFVVNEVGDPVAGSPELPQCQFCPVRSQTLEDRVMTGAEGGVGPHPTCQRIDRCAADVPDDLALEIL